MIIYHRSWRPALLLGGALYLGSWLGSHGAYAEDVPVVCPNTPEKLPATNREDAYKGMPFQPGERAVYEVRYMGVLAGYGNLEVRPPTMHAGAWERVFHADAQTGDWYAGIFTLKDELQALSRPNDFGVSWFYMEQDEGRVFSKHLQQKKWIDFDQEKCLVHEKIQTPDKPEEHKDHPLMRGAADALGVVYDLRTRHFELGKVERALVYTSEKNWWLEALPLAFEKVSVPAGTFNTVKLKLTTFLGKELQQKGDVYAWIARDTKEHQLVMLQGEIKIGSVWIELSKFQPGNP